MEEKFLPIGTIVKLREGTKRVMIIGYTPVTSNGMSFDYTGCLYPEGVINADESLLFNHDQIEQIFALGYSDEEQQEFNAKLINFVLNSKN